MASKLREVLLVEDDYRDAEMVMDTLKKYNLANTIVHARDGEEALDYLFHRGKHANQTHKIPAVILLDLKMPKVDGMEVLKQIRADPRLHSVPIVVMTSSREEKDIVTSYKLGVNGYVVKPVDFHDFVEAVKMVGGFWAVLNEPPLVNDANPVNQKFQPPAS
jgi:CheY-like chemotaxis protein